MSKEFIPIDKLSDDMQEYIFSECLAFARKLREGYKADASDMYVITLYNDDTDDYTNYTVGVINGEGVLLNEQNGEVIYSGAHVF